MISANKDLDPESWEREEVAVEPPFAALYGATSLRRYDLLAKVERDLHLLTGELSVETEEFVEHLVHRLVDHWTWVSDNPTRSQCRKIVDLAVLEVRNLGVLTVIVQDFGWGKSLTVDDASVESFEHKIRGAFASRLTQPTQKLARKLATAERARAA